ncbi:putative ABC transport system permease protein [Actinoplanes tereljensis]|uniref:ABC transporter permease n=1 Tax=Paractinoplanes tereljensis TaxID=571912 RepID=A0A919NZF1_9ACTN|nr:ABC transporter permease [Actinoplanes tereljensis]GIF26756.1 ABC transporter permease [Actinoplanes tereljensis]
MKNPDLAPARMKAGDVLRVGGAGLRARPLRVFLSALGIAIGIAAMIAVVGISSSSQAELNRQLQALGTNLLRVTPGQTLLGDSAELPEAAIGMIGRIGPVESVSATATVDAKVYRNDKIPTAQSGSIAVLAAKTDLPQTSGATIAQGVWLNDATAQYPTVVLGATAAQRLGITAPGPGVQVWLGDQYFTVAGILNPAGLTPELDQSALIGWPIAEKSLGFDGAPTTIYTRAAEQQVTAVQAILANTTNPQNPNEVQVSRPSDALAAKNAADATLNGLLLGLGAVALLVGGVGVANTMVISVLERRAEIGLRRSLGATRGQIRNQFLAESQLLSALGGICGVLIGIAVTAGYATYQGWTSVVPAWAMGGGLAATLLIGGIAGLYPAIRAARLSPTEALTAT